MTKFDNLSESERENFQKSLSKPVEKPEGEQIWPGDDETMTKTYFSKED